MDKGIIEEVERKIPGDIVAESWYSDRPDPAYMDITIGNVFCQSYITGASKELYYVTNLKEKQKKAKYAYVHTLEPMVMDTMGAFGMNFRHIA